MSRSIIAAAVLAALAACGGSDEPRPHIVKSMLGDRPCMAAPEYLALKQRGVFAPRPPLQDGAYWVDPWVLVPAVDSAPIVAAPGLVGAAVVVTGPDGLPKQVTGLYFVDGETPEWVCADD